MLRKTLIVILATLAGIPTINAQLRVPPLSAPTLVSQEIGYTTITVSYERPSVRERSEDEIFGKLVPFGKVWRTGAGPCTTFSFSTPVVIQGTEIPAGIYALFTIPGKEKWTVMFNTDTSAYGAFHYDQKRDAVRFEVVPQRSHRFYEAFTIDLDFIPNDARVYLSWLNTSLAFDIKTGTDQYIRKFIQSELLTGKSNNHEDYMNAVQYLHWHDGKNSDLLILIQKGISLKNERFWYYSWVSILTEEKKYDEAISVARMAIRLIEDSAEEPGYKKDLIADFENMIIEARNLASSH